MRSSRWVVALLLVGLAGCGASTADVGMDREVGVGEVSGRHTVAYGAHADQVVELFVPAGTVTGPTVVLVHGGFWRDVYRADLMVGLAEDLAARGMVAVNVEYRRVGGAGGWPTTLADAAAAVDLLADDEALGLFADVVDADHVVTVGHSAGGHLATWLASRHRIPADLVDDVGGRPVVVPCAAVSQAGVVVLDEAADLSGGAVADLLGGARAEVPDRWAAADPASLLPTGVPVLLVHGEDDDIVPPSQSTRYAGLAAAAGDAARVLAFPGDHFTVIDPSSPSWMTVADQLPTLCRSRAP